MKGLLFILFCAFSSLGFSQQPSYFKIGEDDLAGIHIYDLIQDKDLNYIIATNDGIYRYDFYDFVKIDCPEMTSASLFNLVQNKEGKVYCNNLSGQIFEISGHKCTLYYQIPDSLMNYEISLNFNDRNQLTVLASCLFIINSNREAEILYAHEIKSAFYGDLTADGRGGLYFFDYSGANAYLYRDGNIIKQEISKDTFSLWTVPLDGEIFFFNRSNGGLVYPGNSNKRPHENIIMSEPIIYSDGQNIWKASRTGGARIYTKNLEPLFNEEIVFESYLLSAFATDKEGNVLLGTFGDGIIVIPRLKTEEYKITPSNDGVVKVKVGPNGSLYMGCKSGKVYELTPTRELTLISDVSQKRIEYLALLPSENALIFDVLFEASGLSYNLLTHKFRAYNLYAFKDIKHIHNSKYLVGHNRGLMWFNANTGKIENIPAFVGRTNTVAYEASGNIIYSGSSSGLKIGTSNQASFFELNNEPIICRDMLNHGGKIYISTKKNGVLVFKNGKNIDNWNVDNGLSSNTILKLLPYKKGFVMSAENGVFTVSHEGKNSEKLSTAIGLTNNKAIDIEVFENKLYCVYKSGIKILELEIQNKENNMPSVDLNRWEVNDSTRVLTENNLSYKENKIFFHLSSKTLKYRDEITYHFKLSNVDNTWQKQPHGQNRIGYKSLPPGEYEFQYYVSCQNEIGELQSFTFKIAPPYWKTLWFVLICIIIFLLVVYGIYKVQIRRQKRLGKIKREMIESKLIAIQSQMNPHFIFNSLNSIQDLVLQQEGENAYNYISKFAFLVRQVLHNSELDFVQLESEIELLDVYLQLEQLRFDDDFTFKINDEVDGGVEIPPMIIQPFVENAIKHGLLHKEGDKTLTLFFQLQGEVLICSITDNGIGRKKSKAINQRQAKNHQSFSTKSIQNRFEILQNIHGGKLGLTYVDLENKEGAIGTTVHLKIPIKRDY